MALYAGISSATLTRYIADNPDFAIRLQELKENPVIRARAAVNKYAGASYQNAMDYLKRKKRDEFGDAIDITAQERPMLLGKESYTLLENAQEPEKTPAEQNVNEDNTA